MGILCSGVDAHREDVLEVGTSMFSFKATPCLLVSAQTGSQGPFRAVFAAVFFVGFCLFAFCVFFFVADFAAPRPSTGLKCWLVRHKTAARCLGEKNGVRSTSVRRRWP